MIKRSSNYEDFINNCVFNLVNLIGYINRDSHERNAFQMNFLLN